MKGQLQTDHDVDLFAGGGEMGKRMREHDWMRTPLGPPSNWPRSLKTAVRIMLTSRQPFWLGWGPELTYFYNDPYKSIIGGKHPDALGQPFNVVWREIISIIGPMAEHVINENEGTYVEAMLLIMERNGYPEETHYTFSYSPVPDDEGVPSGLICANTDDTRRVIGERQLATLKDLAAGTANAPNRAAACQSSVNALASNTRDLPFVLIFLRDETGQLQCCASSAGTQALTDVAHWPCEEPLRTGELVSIDMDQRGDLPT